MLFFTTESLIFVAIKCQIRQYKEAKLCRIRPNYVRLVDLGTGRIQWKALSYLNFAIARPLELGQEKEHVRKSTTTTNFCQKVNGSTPVYLTPELVV